MKKLVILMFIFLVIILELLAGCFEEKTEKGPLQGLGYVNDVLMYGFNPPEGFYLKEEGYSKQYVVFEYDPYVNETGQLYLYIYASNISANISFPNRSIEKIAYDLEDSLYNSTDYNVLLVGYNFKTVNGMGFYEILFDSPIGESEESEYRSVYWEYIYVVKDDRVINFQIISSSDLYKNYFDDIENSLSSLTILDLKEEEWNLEKYYDHDDDSNETFIMTAREHFQDRGVFVYFSNIKIFYYTPNAGDTIIIQDNISKLSYNKVTNTTGVSFEWDDNGTIRTLYFLFEGNITNNYNAGDKINITLTIKRVTFSYKDINYDLELYSESWKSEEYFKQNIIRPTDITKALAPLSPNLIEK